MVLKDILSISGESGLFKFIAQGKNAIIVEHLETHKRSSAFGSAKVSSLEEISIFTEKEDLALGKVFDLIYEKESGGPAMDFKSDPASLKTYFGDVLPEYDREKVYVSDIKKVLNWYNILQHLNLLVKEEAEKPAESEKQEEHAAAKDTETTVKKKAAGAKKKVETGKSKPAGKKKSTKAGN